MAIGVIGSKQKNQSVIVGRVRVGLLLRSIREKEGKSQRDSSLGIGYSNATFVCNVEKGAASITINKIMEFAAEYNAVDKYMLAGASMLEVMPEAWENCSRIFAGIYDKKANHLEAEKLVRQWYDKKLEEYGIEI